MLEAIILCTLLAIFIFLIQFILCMKAKKTAVKLIPVYLIFACYATALILYLVELLNGGGGVAIGSIFAFIIVFVATVALFADALSWAIYKLTRRKP